MAKGNKNAGKKSGTKTFDDYQDADFNLLTDAEKEALTAKARDIALKNSKEAAEDAFLEKAIEEAEAADRKERGLGPIEEPIVEHTVNLSQAADKHTINGVHYFHGKTYKVPASLAKCMQDTEFRGHMQEDIRKGNNRNEYGFQTRNGIRGGADVGGVIVA